ncbi:MAG TPA: hypothetical protein VFZ69_04905 [Longimicrobiales bacterium]
MSFFAELKRRRVYQVATVYLAVGFVVIQAADVILPRLGIPDWALSLIVILVILGFPIALVLGWALELTPEGIRVTASSRESASPEPPGSALGRRTIALSLGLVVLGIGIGAGWFLKPAAAAPEERVAAVAAEADAKSIAVLPFEDLSPGSDQEWFSDGLTEEILNSLARIGALHVSARNSSFQFKGRGVDVRDVGRQLGVASVLEGSVRRDGDDLRVTVQLIRAADGFHLWSDTYDRRLDDVFAVQEDIASNIARVLNVYLDEVQRAHMVASGTREPTAYLHYLRGRADYNRAHQLGVGTTALLWEANIWFERALAIDSGYVAARFYHHDAFSHALMGDHAVPAELQRADGSPDMAQLERLMRTDLERALAAAGDTPLGRSLAVVRHYNRGEWERLPAAIAAIDADDFARELDISGGGWLWFPLMLARADELVGELGRLRLERDPLDVNSWSDVIGLELLRGRLDEAERLLERAAELGIEHRYIDDERVKLLLAQGRTDEVLTVLVPKLAAGGGMDWWAAGLAHAHLGDVTAARAALERGGTAARANERRCWILAMIGDQAGANECARVIDAQPQGWTRLARGVIDHGSIPFDAEAAPRFSERYAAMGTRPWPRTVSFVRGAP